MSPAKGPDTMRTAFTHIGKRAGGASLAVLACLTAGCGSPSGSAGATCLDLGHWEVTTGGDPLDDVAQFNRGISEAPSSGNLHQDVTKLSHDARLAPNSNAYALATTGDAQTIVRYCQSNGYGI